VSDVIVKRFVDDHFHDLCSNIIISNDKIDTIVKRLRDLIPCDIKYMCDSGNDYYAILDTGFYDNSWGVDDDLVDIIHDILIRNPICKKAIDAIEVLSKLENENDFHNFNCNIASAVEVMNNIYGLSLPTNMDDNSIDNDQYIYTAKVHEKKEIEIIASVPDEYDVLCSKIIYTPECVL
jgi:hypothetical protein